MGMTFKPKLSPWTSSLGLGTPDFLCLKISDWEPGTDFLSIGPAHMGLKRSPVPVECRAPSLSPAIAIELARKMRWFSMPKP